MTKTSIYQTQVEHYINEQSIVLKGNTQYFVYSVSHEARLNFNNETMELSCVPLLVISKANFVIGLFSFLVIVCIYILV